MYRLSANSRATISSTAIFLSQQSRQYRSSPRGSDTSLAPHNAHFAWVIVFRDIGAGIVLRRSGPQEGRRRSAALPCRRDRQRPPERSAGPYIVSAYSRTMRRALKVGATVTIAWRTVST